MKAYFLIAKDVGDLTAIVCAELEARQAKSCPCSTGSSVASGAGAAARSRSTISSSTTTASTSCDEDAFERDPVNLIRLFWLADRHNLPIHPDATRLATRSLSLIGPSFAQGSGSQPAVPRHPDVATTSPEVVLRRMNEAGVLGRFIPDFGRIVAMMQFNMYHHYTVDEHLIRSIGVLTDIEAGRLGDEHPLANKIFGTIRNRRALYVGDVPARHRQGPAGGPFAMRVPRSRASSGRGSGSTRPRPKRWPGWWNIIC